MVYIAPETSSGLVSIVAAPLSKESKDISGILGAGLLQGNIKLFLTYKYPLSSPKMNKTHTK